MCIGWWKLLQKAQVASKVKMIPDPDWLIKSIRIKYKSILHFSSSLPWLLMIIVIDYTYTLVLSILCTVLHFAHIMQRWSAEECQQPQPLYCRYEYCIKIRAYLLEALQLSKLIHYQFYQVTYLYSQCTDRYCISSKSVSVN